MEIMKIWTKDEKECAAVQKKLLKKGYSWSTSGSQIEKGSLGGLFAHSCGSITYAVDEDYFKEHSYPEYTFEISSGLELVHTAEIFEKNAPKIDTETVEKFVIFHETEQEGLNNWNYLRMHLNTGDCSLNNIHDVGYIRFDGDRLFYGNQKSYSEFWEDKLSVKKLTIAIESTDNIPEWADEDVVVFGKTYKSGELKRLLEFYSK